MEFTRQRTNNVGYGRTEVCLTGGERCKSRRVSNHLCHGLRHVTDFTTNIGLTGRQSKLGTPTTVGFFVFPVISNDRVQVHVNVTTVEEEDFAVQSISLQPGVLQDAARAVVTHHHCCLDSFNGTRVEQVVD